MHSLSIEESIAIRLANQLTAFERKYNTMTLHQCFFVAVATIWSGDTALKAITNRAPSLAKRWQDRNIMFIMRTSTRTRSNTFCTWRFFFAQTNMQEVCDWVVMTSVFAVSQSSCLISLLARTNSPRGNRIDLHVLCCE